MELFFRLSLSFQSLIRLYPYITKSRPIVRAREGERAIPSLCGSRYPTPSLQWGRRDGNRILHSTWEKGFSERRDTHNTTGSYPIYMSVCMELNNSVGHDKARNKAPPLSAKIDPESQTVECRKNGPLSACPCDGSPSSFWGRLLKKWQRHWCEKRFHQAFSRTSCKITSPIRREESGMYPCFFSNEPESCRDQQNYLWLVRYVLNF
ncbi:hypothetical protein HNY73_001001 [Argiope bruennichi]|uniref:Ig-like domain-containing protein n=1 Tax=Argiope bruennichi TaxID=94029 RepID=A0A8T0G070_ARGBR|nr:hypothetical protein HNY73_001001 [Argiope bruennichi]